MQSAPEGWRFCTADFSMQACRGLATGTVLLIRDPDAKKAWHLQPEEVKAADDCPPLYISGEGKTFDEAMRDAWGKSLLAKSIVPPNAM